ncbi:MAG: sterol desaturase family protein [Proteobacteria bacterium]|nr:sterol desaturase family protein [Pseudomonadota bacterium]
MPPASPIWSARELARKAVFPLFLVGALAGAWAAIERGVAPAVVVLPVYFLCMPLVALLERLLPYRREWNHSRRDLAADATYMASTWGVGALASPLFTVLAVAVGGWLSRAGDAGLWPSHWPVLAQVALAAVVAEFFDYWGHRILHESRWLWRVHSIHHSALRVYWLNATRTHPGEVLIRGLFGAIPLGALGVGEPVIALWAVAGRVAGLFQHANIDFALGPLSWVFSVGELHRWHHSTRPAEANTNYGNSFIFWDAVFGTRYLPRDREPPALVGLDGMQAFPTRWTAQLVAPFRWRRIQRESTRRD